MVLSNAAPEVIYDPDPFARRSHSKSLRTNEGQKLMSREVMNQPDVENMDVSMKGILKEIVKLGSSSMPWKERKKLENQYVVSLGGKPPKKERLQFSVAKVSMKKKKQKEEKKLKEEQLLGKFMRNGSNSKANNKKRRREDEPLMATEGYFRRGVLDVKSLLASDRVRGNGRGDGGMPRKSHKASKNAKQQKGKKGGGRGRGRGRH